MALVDDLVQRRLIGIQRRAEIVDTSTLTPEQVKGNTENALKKWTNTKLKIGMATEMGASVARVEMFAALPYHSPPSKAFLDEVVRLATEDGFPPTIDDVPSDNGLGRKISLVFDIDTAITAAMAAASVVTP